MMYESLTDDAAEDRREVEAIEAALAAEREALLEAAEESGHLIFVTVA